MESIINIEDRLRVIKAIFELSIEAKVLPHDIYIYTIHQEWGATSKFRPEILSLSIDDPRHKKTIDIIYRLSNDIIALFDQLKLYIGEIKHEYKYRIDCMPGGNSLGQLYLVRIKVPEITKELSDEEISFLMKEDQFIDGEWWPYKGISNHDNSDFVCTSPLFLIDFVMQINQFLKDRILICATPQQKENYVPNGTLPHLPECFINVKDWESILQDSRVQDFCEKTEIGTHRWIGKKNLLAGLAWRLLNKNKLIASINSGQQLAKIFCSYFGVKFNPKDERQFRPERALIDRFRWID